MEKAPDRRRFLEAVVWIGGGGVALALGLPGAAYLLTPVLREEERTWVDISSSRNTTVLATPVRNGARRDPIGVLADSPVCPSHWEHFSTRARE